MRIRPLPSSFQSLLLPVAAAALLSACSGKEEPIPAETARPVKTMVVTTPEVGGIRRFPGRVDALNKAELAFRVPGTIQELPIKEGDRVEAGQLLAALDPTDYEIAVKDVQATFDRADKDFKRAEELVADGFISRTDFDAKEAERKNAQAALDRAQQDLIYTRLTAAFDGTVARRYVQRFEEVQAKQAVMVIQDNSLLEVKVDIPEAIVMGVRPPPDGSRQDDQIPVTASFEGRPGQQFDLRLRELATRADPETQTFEVTFTMPAPEDFRVFPGMTATVMADFSQVSTAEASLVIPASAVTADEKLQPFVWVVDEDTLRVHKTPVEVGDLSGHSIALRSAFEAGTRIVVAGVGYLAEGMQVRLLLQREEAEPRAEDATPPAGLPPVSGEDARP